MFRTIHRNPPISFALAALCVTAACSPEPVSKAAPPPTTEGAGVTSSKPTSSVANGGIAESAAAAAPAQAAAAQRTDSARTTPDSALDVRLPAGRTRQDRSSFIAAVRAGERAMASWPKGPAAAPGALLPNTRIVAYYGNPHSKRMGVLGEYPEQQMLSMLDQTIAEWKKADPSTPVMPAIHLVTVVAQGDPGADGGWRRRESPEMIERAYKWAQSRKGLLFVDIQAGHSTLQQELPLLLKYLERPDVHLGVDPEFYMHYKREGVRPSAKVGQMMASDVNYAIQTLDKLVREKKLPPKIIVVHRFRQDMVPDAESIRPTANVQVVMDMDGWGPPWLKFDSYRDYIVRHPVQFTGFKLFYHNDVKKGDPILTPAEVLRLRPKPLYIQYQ